MHRAPWGLPVPALAWCHISSAQENSTDIRRYRQQVWVLWIPSFGLQAHLVSRSLSFKRLFQSLSLYWRGSADTPFYSFLIQIWLAHTSRVHLGFVWAKLAPWTVTSLWLEEAYPSLKVEMFTWWPEALALLWSCKPLVGSSSYTSIIQTSHNCKWKHAKWCCTFFSLSSGEMMLFQEETDTLICIPAQAFPPPYQERSVEKNELLSILSKCDED